MYRNQILNPRLMSQAAEQQNPSLTPEAIVEQLRAIKGQIPDASPMTTDERAMLRSQGRTAKNGEILQTTISLVGTTDVISNAVGHDADGVRELCDNWNRWSVVEDELRSLLNGVSSANLARRQQLAAIADTAYGVGSKLARYPGHADVVPHVAEIRRLRKGGGRKKATTTPQPPSPNGPVTPKA